MDGLERLVACAWTAFPTGTHLLVPDGCVDLLWLSTGELWLCGPETSAWTFELPAGTTAVGVRFRPGVAAIVLGIDIATVRDRRERLGALVGENLALGFAAEIDAAQEPSRRRDTLERIVAELAVRSDPAAELDFVDAVLDGLAASPRACTAELAVVVGLGERQLHRQALRLFGYGTATLARLLRFQRFLAFADASQSPVSLTWLANEAGYSDHAHLSRDCRLITGRTPSNFLADYFPTFPDMSDPYRTRTPLTASGVAR